MPIFLEAYFQQLITGLTLRLVPFRMIPRLYRCRATGMPGTATQAIGNISQAIHRSGRFSPWRNRCLVQSLAARRMLERRKIVSQLSMGVMKDEKGRVIAHAWIEANGIEIVSKGGDYTELFFF